MTAPLSMPSAKTREWQRKAKSQEKELRTFLKSQGVSSKAKLRLAAKRGSVRNG